MVVVYQVDQATGGLKLIQNLRLTEEGPRGCALSPDGRFLVVTCVGSGKVVTLAVGGDGTLTDTGIRTEQPNAAFISFYRS